MLSRVCLYPFVNKVNTDPNVDDCIFKNFSANYNVNWNITIITIRYFLKTFKDYSVDKDPANDCLDVAIITDPKIRTKKTIKKLKNIAGRVLNKK